MSSHAQADALSHGTLIDEMTTTDETQTSLFENALVFYDKGKFYPNSII
jgi:hypothetical protein